MAIQKFPTLRDLILQVGRRRNSDFTEAQADALAPILDDYINRRKAIQSNILADPIVQDVMNNENLKYVMNPNLYYQEKRKELAGVDMTKMTDEQIHSLLADYKEVMNQPVMEGEKTNLELEMKNISDYVGKRSTMERNKEDVGKFLQEAPLTLAEQRQKFFQGQRAGAKDVMAQYTMPQIIEQLNARGMARQGGILGDILGTKMSEIESTISSAEQQQAISDAQMFADMSYKTTLQDLVEKTQSARDVTAGEFARLRLKQGQEFAGKQSDIQRSFQVNQYAQENEAALRAYQQQLLRAAASNGSNKGLWQQVGAGAGMAIGAGVGALLATAPTGGMSIPMGVALGAGLGGGVGGMAGSIPSFM